MLHERGTTTENKQQITITNTITTTNKQQQTTYEAGAGEHTLHNAGDKRRRTELGPILRQRNKAIGDGHRLDDEVLAVAA